MTMRRLPAMLAVPLLAAGVCFGASAQAQQIRGTPGAPSAVMTPDEAFIALDTRGRSRKWTYAITVVAAFAFAIVMCLWQQSLPTRVTALPDTISNALGALAGAALGHARKSVRFRFAI